MKSNVLWKSIFGRNYDTTHHCAYKLCKYVKVCLENVFCRQPLNLSRHYAFWGYKPDSCIEYFNKSDKEAIENYFHSQQAIKRGHGHTYIHSV